MARYNNHSAVLGLCSYTHDSSAALIVDGAFIGFAEEERFVNEKHTRVYPAQTVEWLLQEAGITADEITSVGYNVQAGRYLAALCQIPGQLWQPVTRARAWSRARSFTRMIHHTRVRERDLARRFPSARVASVLHHRTHGLYAFASAGYDSAAVLTVDSMGEIQSTTIAHGRLTGNGGVGYHVAEAINDPASLGYVYGAITEYLGWQRGEGEGTVMALAALGDPERFRGLFTRMVPLTAHGFRVDPTLIPPRVLYSGLPRISSAFTEASWPPRQPDEPIQQVHADMAAALQERTETVMLHLARRAKELTGERLLCVAGGTTMNCVAIGRIVETGMFDEVHVPPAPADSGTAIGAAIDLHLATTGTLAQGVEARCYLGPAYSDLTLPAHPRPGVTACRPDEPARLLARRLADGGIVGLFQGRLEAGPRALGNRSILASPLLPDVVDRLNKTVKFREPFRPFAPMVLADAARDYFTLRQATPYMSIASGVTDMCRDKIPAIVHANGTARIQTVAAGENPFVAEVLAEFEKITGTPVLINTSLNIKGKPICGTPDLALDCLVESGMDALLLESWWVTK